MKEFEEWYKLHIFYKNYDYLTKDLADFLKVNPRTIQRWIRGRAKPDTKKLGKIKEYLIQKSAKETCQTPHRSS